MAPWVRALEELSRWGRGEEKKRSLVPNTHAHLNTALCAHRGTLLFDDGGGCCSKVRGKHDGGKVAPCVPLGDLLRERNVSHVDFWSLDVEGWEEQVLLGMDWSIPVSVLLIESATPAIRKLLRSKGMRHHAFSSPSRLNTIWVGPVRHHVTVGARRGTNASYTSVRT
jgi:hypothetical protein